MMDGMSANKQKFIMLVGLPYSGKDYYIAQHQKDNDIVVSSDEIRGEIWGDENNQRDPEMVFKVMRERAIEALRNGHNVWYNATNLTSKRRISFIKDLRKRFKNYDITYECIIMAPMLETIEERQKNCKRERVVSSETIKKMIKRFQTPMFYEGWDYIGIKQNSLEELINWNCDDIMTAFVGMPHNNSHHSLSIDEHMHKAAKYAKEKHECLGVIRALAFHDIGKFFTKQFTDKKGNPTKEAHYFNHENYGAYIILAYDIFPDPKIVLLVSWLINNHMRHFSKDFEKWGRKNKVNPELIEALKIMAKYDEAAH